MKKKNIILGLLVMTSLVPIDSYNTHAIDAKRIYVMLPDLVSKEDVTATFENSINGDNEVIDLTSISSYYYLEYDNAKGYDTVSFSYSGDVTRHLSLNDTYPCYVLCSTKDASNYLNVLSLKSMTPTTSKVSARFDVASHLCDEEDTIYVRVDKRANSGSSATIVLRGATNKEPCPMNLLEDDGSYYLYSYTLTSDDKANYTRYNLVGENGTNIITYRDYSKELNKANNVYQYEFGSLASSISYTYYEYDNIGIRFGFSGLNTDFYNIGNIDDISFEVIIQYSVGLNTYYSSKDITPAIVDSKYQGAYGIYLDTIDLPEVDDNYDVSLTGNVYLHYHDQVLDLGTRSYTYKELLDAYLASELDLLDDEMETIVTKLKERL